MVNMGLSLVKVCIEVSRNVVERFPSLLVLVKDDMCRYLFQVMNFISIHFYIKNKLCFVRLQLVFYFFTATWLRSFKFGCGFLESFSFNI